MELKTASPRNSNRSLFSSAPSRTERWLSAVLYKAISVGEKPSIFWSWYLKDLSSLSVLKKLIKNRKISYK